MTERDEEIARARELLGPIVAQKTDEEVGLMLDAIDRIVYASLAAYKASRREAR